MPDHPDFLRAIVERPGDDTVRLVYADWLDDNGDPDRAEFVRTQCALEPVRDDLDNIRVQALWRREDHLLAANFPAWAGAAADLAATEPQFGPVFVRGFPDRVSVSLDTWLARGGEILAACPTLRTVAIFGATGRRHRLVATRGTFGSVETVDAADTPTPPARPRFPLFGDLGDGLLAGHLPRGTACLAAVTADGGRVYLVTFNADGTFSKTVWEDGRGGAWTADRLRDRFGFAPGLVRVREFRDRGLAVRQWPAALQRPALPGQPDRGGVMRKWLEFGRFVVEWRGREHVLDRRGRIVG